MDLEMTAIKVKAQLKRLGVLKGQNPSDRAVMVASMGVGAIALTDGDRTTVYKSDDLLRLLEDMEPEEITLEDSGTAIGAQNFWELVKPCAIPDPTEARERSDLHGNIVRTFEHGGKGISLKGQHAPGWRPFIVSTDRGWGLVCEESSKGKVRVGGVEIPIAEVGAECPELLSVIEVTGPHPDMLAIYLCEPETVRLAPDVIALLEEFFGSDQSVCELAYKQHRLNGLTRLMLWLERDSGSIWLVDWTGDRYNVDDKPLEAAYWLERAQAWIRQVNEHQEAIANG